MTVTDICNEQAIAETLSSNFDKKHMHLITVATIMDMHNWYVEIMVKQKKSNMWVKAQFWPQNMKTLIAFSNTIESKSVC